MFQTPQLVSSRVSALIPAGIVVGYEGTVASLSAYPDWDLCDGTGGTPDLTDRFVIGADGATYAKDNTGGSLAGAVSGTTSTEGLHSPGDSGPQTMGGGFPQMQNPAGDHSHVVAGDLDEPPPARQVVFIKSSTETVLPAEAVAWLNAGAASGDFSAFAAAADRMLIGVGNDSRTQLGADNRAATISVTTGGSHDHNNGTGSSGGGGVDQTPLAAGDHSHTDFGDTIAVPKPPFLALLAVKASSATGAVLSLVLAYDGLLANLPNGWAECDGTGGTPDLRGRIPLGASGTNPLGSTGGQDTTAAVSGSAAVPSTSDSHNHGPSGTSNVTGGHHDAYPWTHGHASWSGDVDPMPEWHALYFVMFTGA